MNGTLAQQKIAELNRRATMLGVLTAIAFGLGVIVVIVNASIASNSYSSDVDLTGVTVGSGLVGVASLLYIAWAITRTMADHAQVVYFSATGDPASPPMTAPVGSPSPRDSGVAGAVSVNTAGKYWKCTCGAINDLTAASCRACGVSA